MIAALPMPAVAQVPADNQALLVLRILAFDRRLADRAANEVRIAVLFKLGSGESERCQIEIERAIGEASKKQTVARLNVRAEPLAVSAGLAGDLRRLKASAAYVCPGLDDQTEAIAKATRGVGALTFSGVEDYARGGLSVALVKRDPRVSIVVNLPASRAEGADLDAGLLKVAEVIR